MYSFFAVNSMQRMLATSVNDFTKMYVIIFAHLYQRTYHKLFNSNELQHYTNQLAKNTSESLKELQRLPQPLTSDEQVGFFLCHSGSFMNHDKYLLMQQRQRKMLKERFTNEFSEVLKNFMAVQRQATQKERESIARARNSSSTIKPVRQSIILLSIRDFTIVHS